MKETTSERLDQQIESYLSGALKTKELKAFERRISQEKELAEEVLFRKRLRFTVKKKSAIQFQDKVKQTMTKYRIEPDMTMSRTSFWGYSIWLLASFVGLIAFGLVGGYFYITSENRAISQLEARYVNHFENKLSISNSTHPMLASGLRAYNEKQYGNAIKYLKSYEQQRPGDIQPIFYLGMSYFMDKKMDLAIPYFQKLIAQKEILFLEHSQWFLAWCYLKLDRKTEAITIFKSLESSDNYEVEIIEILKFLEK